MNIFAFGEDVAGYDIKVINERVARGGAGILFTIGLITFMSSFLTHNFILAKIFITLFFVDFFIRVAINPKYSPSLILSYIMVKSQTPEYVGAPQKRFAWSIGLLLAVIMFFIVVVFDFMTPIKIVICLLCLVLLLSESAFGLCVGCKMYNFIKKETRYCAGGCEISNQPNSTIVQKIILLTTVGLLFYGYSFMKKEDIDTASPWKVETNTTKQSCH